MPALEMHQARKVYGSDDQQVVALNDVDLTVEDDEMLILVGPSGSGKTTLLTVAGALLRPTSGSVRVGDTEITDLDAANENVNITYVNGVAPGPVPFTLNDTAGGVEVLIDGNVYVLLAGVTVADAPMITVTSAVA